VTLNSNRVLAVIPARGGSKGLPGKNIRPFAGLPLIAHSILFAKSCPEISRTIVSTDTAAIQQAAEKYGASVPFLRPRNLAQDDTPLWPVLRHALENIETIEEASFDYVMLLDPTTPCRLPRYAAEALARLREKSDADGIIAVSKPDFNPIWHSVTSSDGWMTDLIPEAARYNRRQDAPDVYRINGALYIWRADFIRRQADGWRSQGKHLLYEVPDFASISIDTEDEFKRAELFVTSGLFPLPWLKEKEISCAP
jgi:CMP-N,N'-diacetyllegionaminic acid synthase